MAKLSRHICLLIGALALMLAVTVSTPSMAQQQPSSVNPTASAVKEKDLLDQMKIISGRGTIPDARSYNIEQPAGRDWRHFHNVTLWWIGTIAILGMLAVLVIFRDQQEVRFVFVGAHPITSSRTSASMRSPL